MRGSRSAWAPEVIPQETRAGNLGEVTWHRLSGAEFEGALSGTFDKHWKRVSQPWLDAPKLKYYMRRSCLCRGQDTRVFFLATVAGADGKGRGKKPRTAIGALEVASEDGTAATVGIKYVSVSEAWRGKGIATRLYEDLAGYLKSAGLKLYRTRPGQETPAEFTAAVTRMLDSAGVEWFTREW